MLERLRIQNFKSWQDTGNMAFGSLTGFFGTNSSGKSSILQFLLMLKQTVESSDRSAILNLGESTSYVELGTFADVIHRRNVSKTLSFEFTWLADNVSRPKNRYESEYKTESFTFSSSIRDFGGITVLLNFKYKTAGGRFGMNLLLSSKFPQVQYSFISRGNATKNNENDSYGFPNPVKFYQFPNDAYAYRFASRSLEIPAFELEKFFEKIFYLGPLREYPNRLYIWGGQTPQGVGNRGERSVAAMLSNRNQGPTIDVGEGQPKRTVEEHIAYWLKELSLIHSFKVQAIAEGRKEYEVRIQRTPKSASVFLTDVGFGVSQILPVLVLLFYVPEGSTVILEQPEIHLHPAVQAGLADVFIDAIKRRKLQIILESHSEHLLQRLQRRIAEEVISQEEIKLYFTSIEEGKSKLTTLQLDEYGNISNWPAGFFGDAFAEAAAKMKAEMNRKMQQQ